jgi:uncharacterized membrane protein YdjX (TVP38/TMEM64 family)
LEAVSADHAAGRRRSALTAIIVLLLVVACAALATLLPVKAMLEGTLEWTAAHRQTAWVLFIVIYVVATVLLVPGLILTLAGGAIFGFAYGVALVSLSSVLAATVAFFLGRTIAHQWVSARIDAWPKFHALNRALAERGFWIVLLTRLSPAFPFVLLNYAYGITRVRLTHYVLGSWLGMFPATVTYVYAGSTAADLAQALAGHASLGAGRWVLAGVGLIATIAATLLVARRASRNLNQELST